MSNEVNKVLNQQTSLEQEILSKVRGVFKYRTLSSNKDHCTYTSRKYDLVQVGYLDLEDNIVFNEIQRPEPDSSASIVRYLPGFEIRQYRSCETYIPSLIYKPSKEIREVISSTVIEYTSGNYSSKKEFYSVIGFINDTGQLVYYDQVMKSLDN